MKNKKIKTFRAGKKNLKVNHLPKKKNRNE